MTSPLTIRSAIRTRRQFLDLLGPVLDRVEEALDSTNAAQAPLRRELRKLIRRLDAADNVNLLYPPTKAAVLGLVAVGLATPQEATRILFVPPQDVPPDVEAPANTVPALWDGWEVFAAQPQEGEEWAAQTPIGDAVIRHPDYLVTMKMGGAQYRARINEVVILDSTAGS